MRFLTGFPILLSYPLDLGDIIQAEVRKSDPKQEAGLKLEEKNGMILVRKVDGLFKRRNIPIIPGDRIHTINGKDVEDYQNGLNDIKALIKREIKICIKFERMEEMSDESEEEEQEELLMLEGPEELLQLEYQQDDKDEEEEDEEEVLHLTNGPIDSQASFKPGVQMRLFKLKKKPKLNGTIVKIVKPGKPGRWDVELMRHPMRKIEPGAIMSVSEENLKEL